MSGMARLCRHASARSTGGRTLAQPQDKGRRMALLRAPRQVFSLPFR